MEGAHLAGEAGLIETDATAQYRSCIDRFDCDYVWNANGSMTRSQQTVMIVDIFSISFVGYSPLQRRLVRRRIFHGVDVPLPDTV